MKILEVTYRSSRYVEDTKIEMQVVKRLTAADEHAEKLLTMDFKVSTFPDWQAVKSLQYALLYIEELKNCSYIFDSIVKIREVKDYEPLCEPKEQ